MEPIYLKTFVGHLITDSIDHGRLVRIAHWFLVRNIDHFLNYLEDIAV